MNNKEIEYISDNQTEVLEIKEEKHSYIDLTEVSIAKTSDNSIFKINSKEYELRRPRKIPIKIQICDD